MCCRRNHVNPALSDSFRKTDGLYHARGSAGNSRACCFPPDMQEVSPWVETGKIVLVRGKVDLERGNAKVLVDQISTELSLTQAHSGNDANRGFSTIWRW